MFGIHLLLYSYDSCTEAICACQKFISYLSVVSSRLKVLLTAKTYNLNFV